MVQAETQAERAFDQVVGWLEHFEPLEDPRQAGKVPEQDLPGRPATPSGRQSAVDEADGLESGPWPPTKPTDPGWSSEMAGGGEEKPEGFGHERRNATRCESACCP